MTEHREQHNGQPNEASHDQHGAMHVGGSLFTPFVPVSTLMLDTTRIVVTAAVWPSSVECVA